MTEIDNLNAKPWLGLVLIMTLIMFSAISWSVTWMCHKTLLELNEEIELVKSRQDILAQAIKAVAFQTDTLTEAYLNK